MEPFNVNFLAPFPQFSSRRGKLTPPPLIGLVPPEPPDGTIPVRSAAFTVVSTAFLDVNEPPLAESNQALDSKVKASETKDAGLAFDVLVVPK